MDELTAATILDSPLEVVTGLRAYTHPLTSAEAATKSWCAWLVLRALLVVETEMRSTRPVSGSVSSG